MLSSGIKDIRAGKLEGFANRDIFGRDGIRAGGSARKSGINSSATEYLDCCGNEIVAELFVQETTIPAAVKYQLAVNCVHARKRCQIRALAPTLLRSKLISTQDANRGSKVGGRHIVKTDRGRAHV